MIKLTKSWAVSKFWSFFFEINMPLMKLLYIQQHNIYFVFPECFSFLAYSDLIFQHHGKLYSWKSKDYLYNSIFNSQEWNTKI